MPSNKTKEVTIDNQKKYDPDTHPQLIAALAARLETSTMTKIAPILGITSATLGNWKKKHPAVAFALKASSEYVNSEVEAKIFLRAVGYNYLESTVIRERIKNKDGSLGEWVETKQEVKKKHVPPSEKAALAFLYNRDRKNWQMTPLLPTEELNRTEQLTLQQQREKLADMIKKQPKFFKQIMDEALNEDNPN